ncbi:glycosyltransferase [bacterium]|nr:glycosyltransferase [bacterium]
MRVLVIAHNVISETNNMGKTLLSYFKDFAPEEIAEFYIQDKDPNNAEVANNYYRFTDKDALKSVFGIRTKHVFKISETGKETTKPNNKGAAESIRQYGRKRNAFVYIARNAVWSLAHWKTKEFLGWLHDFNPDVIFFMAGDYSFMFKIAREIKEMLNKPLVVCCVDDYFFFNRNDRTFLGRLQHRAYMKSVRKTMAEASCIFTISDLMGEAYHKLFDKPCRTLHTSAKKRESGCGSTGRMLAYFGNLSFKRYEQLIEIGKTVKKLKINGIDGVDVYSAEKNPEYLQGLTEENGIRFHGEIPSSEVAECMDRCMAVIHTESFRQRTQQMVRYSVSTKIADSLLNGPCLIAYGPEAVASIDYLKKNKAAYVITKKEDLENGLLDILSNEKLRTGIIQNARELAAKNHDEALNPKKVREWLQTVSENN